MNSRIKQHGNTPLSQLKITTQNLPIAASRIRTRRGRTFFLLVQNLLVYLPYFYQNNTCAIALPRATPSSATRALLTSAIVRCQDDKFDTACLSIGDRFPIRRGFAIVT
jgi:hypothetical protein